MAAQLFLLNQRALFMLRLMVPIWQFWALPFRGQALTVKCTALRAQPGKL